MSNILRCTSFIPGGPVSRELPISLAFLSCSFRKGEGIPSESTARSLSTSANLTYFRSCFASRSLNITSGVNRGGYKVGLIVNRGTLNNSRCVGSSIPEIGVLA